MPQEITPKGPCKESTSVHHLELLVGHLREDHGQILIPAGQPSQPGIALITRDAAAKPAVWKKRKPFVERWYARRSCTTVNHPHPEFQQAAHNSNHGKNKRRLSYVIAITCSPSRRVGRGCEREHAAVAGFDDWGSLNLTR
jgi:hypothetical protein